MRDMHNNIEPKVALSPESAFTDDGTYVGPIIDRLGYQSVEFLIVAGKLLDAAATFTPSLEAGDAASLSDAAAVGASELLGTIANATFSEASDYLVKKLGYIGKKRYLRLTMTPSGNTAEAFFAAVAVLGHADNKPSEATPTANAVPA